VDGYHLECAVHPVGAIRDMPNQIRERGRVPWLEKARRLDVEPTAAPSRGGR